MRGRPSRFVTAEGRDPASHPAGARVSRHLTPKAVTTLGVERDHQKNQLRGHPVCGGWRAAAGGRSRFAVCGSFLTCFERGMSLLAGGKQRATRGRRRRVGLQRPFRCSFGGCSFGGCGFGGCSFGGCGFGGCGFGAEALALRRRKRPRRGRGRPAEPSLAPRFQAQSNTTGVKRSSADTRVRPLWTRSTASRRWP